MNLRTVSSALAVAAVAFLWTCAATASATSVTAAEGEIYTGTIKAESEGSITMDGPVNVACGKSVIEGAIESHGPEVPAAGAVSSLTFSECGKDTVTVVNPGTLKLQATSEGDGTLTSTSAEITVLTHLSIFNITVHCIYKTNGTELGNVTGSYPSEGNATVDVASPIPQAATDGLCGSEAELTGSYKVTTPSVLSVVQVPAEPNVIFTWEPGNIKKGEEKIVSVIEKSSEVDYTLEKIELASVTGGLILEEAEDCKGVSVKKGQGEHELCNVSLICDKPPGDAAPFVRTFWSDKPVIKKIFLSSKSVNCVT